MRIFTNPDQAGHNPRDEFYRGQRVPCFENPTRARYVLDALAARGARVDPPTHDSMAALATGADQDRCAAECAVTPMCCNTFSFDICNRSMLFRRQDGESALESSLSPLR